ncbi:MAG: amidohydrolase family protein [Proteobacteria bacterium]|nr:amidohydrolase family protein [Pseudomonadota bacterium]
MQDGVAIFAAPKIDCHVHVLDPEHFPYAPDTRYRPAGQEMGGYADLVGVMDAYGTRHALIVGPNSGYGLDNRYLLHALRESQGRCKGIAVVRNDASRDELAALKAAGIVGVAWNVTFYGLDYYDDADPLLARLRDLDLCVSIQVEHDQFAALAPRLRDSGVRILVDHCGRPTAGEGLQQAGFRAVCDFAATGRGWVKLSGVAKFTREAFPYADAAPYFDALVAAYTPARCLWASDWPYLRAPKRMDYGVLLRQFERVVPDRAAQRAILWDTPATLLGF